MIDADTALALVLSEARPFAPRSVSPDEALGLVLAESVRADRDYPPFDRATMDGFAVRLSHAGRKVTVAGEGTPGRAAVSGVGDDGCVEIMTGSPVPSAAEAVVMREEVSREGASRRSPGSSRAGQNIVRRGAECVRGAEVLQGGATLTPIALGLLSFLGQRRVAVRPVPTLDLFVTGDELAGSGETPSETQIRDSNGPTLAAMARAAGVRVARVLSVKDTMPALASALAAADAADVVVLTGGVSAGNHDLVPVALAQHGVTTVFHKVRQQPGKPILFGTKGARLFFGLPGTPLGCHLGFHRYVLPAARALAGLPPRGLEVGALTTPWETRSDRRQFVLARASRSEGRWNVTPLAPKGSSDLFAVWSANAYMNVPEGVRSYAAGAEVTLELLD